MIVRVALALALLVAPWVAPWAAPGQVAAETSGSGLVIEIKDGQLVTMSGQAASLAQLVGDLCAKTGTTLRGYEAGDRPIMVSYQDVPLRDVLQRMLRDETYMIGVRAGESSRNGSSDLEVSWVHVTGSKSGTAPANVVAVPLPAPSAPPAKVPGSMAGFGVAGNVITQALGAQNADERRAATLQLAEHLEANPGELDNFLATDLGSTADELSAFEFANEALRTISIRQKDAVARAKIDAIVKMVGLRRNDAPKPPGFAELMQQGMPH
jgi:hypothetical protein